MNRTAIINYGVGNVLSIKRSLDYLRIKSIITNDKKIKNCSHLILPGVGALLCDEIIKRKSIRSSY